MLETNAETTLLPLFAELSEKAIKVTAFLHKLKIEGDYSDEIVQRIKDAKQDILGMLKSKRLKRDGPWALSISAKYKYGFTATAWRKDKLQFLMWRLIGNRNAKVTRQVVVRDPERNQLIEREVRKRANTDTQTLVLTGRIEHANLLSWMLEDLSPVLLTGELSKQGRAQGMEEVRNGTCLTIATTALLGEGVDVPAWNLLFLVCPIAGGPRTLQAMGRVARPAPGKKKALVVDFVDSEVEMLKAAFRKRQELYAA
ncbi:hypothetical protein MYX82_08115 [Acidobacteria bacterium AH-259-D05]|nr:hypothetical protein [Acidobacteria bacterium AH-259-D05]